MQRAILALLICSLPAFAAHPQDSPRHPGPMQKSPDEPGSNGGGCGWRDCKCLCGPDAVSCTFTSSVIVGGSQVCWVDCEYKGGMGSGRNIDCSQVK